MADWGWRCDICRYHCTPDDKCNCDPNSKKMDESFYVLELQWADVDGGKLGTNRYIKPSLEQALYDARTVGEVPVVVGNYKIYQVGKHQVVAES